jgi:aryl-alcohol dehydrogenase-like predicted oxidoreductase
MSYRILGRTGLKVSVLGMGRYGIGKCFYNKNDEESVKTLYDACFINQ